jgi:hypothetical protein
LRGLADHSHANAMNKALAVAKGEITVLLDKQLKFNELSEEERYGRQSSDKLMIIDVGAKYGSHAKILLSSLPTFYRDRVLYVAVRPDIEHYD